MSYTFQTSDDHPTVTDVIGVRSFFFDDGKDECVALDFEAFVGRITNREGFHASVSDWVPAIVYFYGEAFRLAGLGVDEDLPADASPEEILGYWISLVAGFKED